MSYYPDPNNHNAIKGMIVCLLLAAVLCLMTFGQNLVKVLFP